MIVKHCEHMLSAKTKAKALQLIRIHFANYRKKYGIKKWQWRIPPEAAKYAGKGKKYAGLWLAYGRISFER